MDVVIIAQYLRNIEELKGNNSRFIYLANLLSEKENMNVEIITSDFMHGSYTHASKVDQSGNYKITAIREPGYHKSISIKRIFSHKRLAKNISEYLKTRKIPDCIYCAIPSLDVANVAAKYCNQNNVKFIIDVQDLWPEAFQMVFNVPVLSKMLFWPLKQIADQVYKQADEICAVSKTYANRAKKVNYKCKDAHVIFLGTRLETFDEYAQKNVIKKPKNELWMGYCGTLGASYDITVAIDALSILAKRGLKPPRFIILGDGRRKKEFEQHAKNVGVDCVFTGQLPYDKMCGWLAMCDIAVNPIMHNAAQSIINKHADYAASGIPVLNTQESKEYRELVDQYNMGFNCPNQNAKELAEKIKVLMEDADMRNEMGKNARKCAEERFDRKYTYQEIVKLIESETRL